MSTEKYRKYKREYMRKYYKTHTIQMQKVNRRGEYARLQLYRKLIYEHQISMGGCTRCGIFPTKQLNLDFHHLDKSTKLFGLAEGYKYSWQEVLEEIKKCIILCKSCHNIVEPRGFIL